MNATLWFWLPAKRIEKLNCFAPVKNARGKSVNADEDRRCSLMGIYLFECVFISMQNSSRNDEVIWKRAHNERNNQFEKITQNISWKFVFFRCSIFFVGRCLLHGMTEFPAISSSYDIRHNLLFRLPSGVKFVFRLRFVCWSKMIFVFLLSENFIRIFVMDFENACHRWKFGAMKRQNGKNGEQKQNHPNGYNKKKTANCQQYRAKWHIFWRWLW